MKHTVEDFIGVSAVMQAIRAEVEYAAGCNAKVLLTGESGVGKEVASRRIHQLSARAHAPLVAINCVGIPETLLESELFGHVRGSFTGAHRDRVGLLEMAHRGTVFLDEVGEMGPRMQALLLRFLETGEIQRVGADRVQSKLDVRVIAATNRDPARARRGQDVPRRPLLPVERDRHHDPAAPIAPRRHPGAAGAFPSALQRTARHRRRRRSSRRPWARWSSMTGRATCGS